MGLEITCDQHIAVYKTDFLLRGLEDTDEFGYTIAY